MLAVLCCISAVVAQSSCGALEEPCSVELLQMRMALQKGVRSTLHVAADTSKNAIASAPPIGLVKTHKTGSSTLFRILSNFVFRRGMPIMFPEDHHHLGWPHSFPGQENEVVAPQHQYEFIGHHAVFNSEKWRSYLAPHPHFTSLLREPSSQAVSAYNYYFESWSWPEFIKTVSETQAPRSTKFDFDLKVTPYLLNPQAWDLGWYEYVGFTTEYDRNDSVIQTWLDDLQEKHFTAGMVLTEYYDEGLVILAKSLKCTPDEFAYIRQNEGSNRSFTPSADQLQQLANLYTVDRALYDHFNKTFWDMWLGIDAVERNRHLSQLRNTSAHLDACCQAGGELICECPWQWNSTFDVPRFTSLLHNLTEKM